MAFEIYKSVFDFIEVTNESFENKFDIISHLPLEMSQLIMTFLDNQSLLNASKVSNVYKNIVNQNMILKMKCQRQAIWETHIDKHPRFQMLNKSNLKFNQQNVLDDEKNEIFNLIKGKILQIKKSMKQKRNEKCKSTKSQFKKFR